jgi:hypothetical protein
MESYLLAMFAIGAAVLLVGSFYCVYQLFKIVQTDAACRGLKHPKLWGVLAASGQNQSGLLLYLIGRRKYPVIAMTDEQKFLINIGKKKFGAGLVLVTIGGIVCVLAIVFMR